MTDVRKLFRRSQSLEKELVELSKDRLNNEEKIAHCRTKVAEKYEKIMLLDPEFAVKYDVAHLLWKAIYYKQIEHFRGKAKKYQLSKKEKHQQHFEQMVSSFCFFLDDGVKELQTLCEKIRSHGGESVALSTILCTLTVSMGDLARYKAVYETGPGKGDWSVAKGFYKKALLLNKGSGLGHNQMAVLASYEMDDFEAMYHHYRSLATKKAFPSARENLINLFNRNNLKLMSDGGKKDLKGDTKPAPRIEDGMSHFKDSFVRIQGMIFTKIGCEDHPANFAQLLSGLGPLIGAGRLEETILVKMMLCNAFLVENATAEHLTTPTNDKGRAILLLAWKTAAQFFVQIVKGLADHTARPFLGGLAVFLGWLQHSAAISKLMDDSQDLLAHICQLANLIVDIVQKSPKESETALLEEDCEVRGFIFLPPAVQEEKVDLDADGALGKTFAAADHPFAVHERCRRILRVADWLVTEGRLGYNANTAQYTVLRIDRTPGPPAQPPEGIVDCLKSVSHPGSLKFQPSEPRDTTSPTLVSPQTYATDEVGDEADLDDFVDDCEQIIFQGVHTETTVATAESGAEPEAPNTAVSLAVQNLAGLAQSFPTMMGMAAPAGLGSPVSNPGSFFASPLFFTPQHARPADPSPAPLTPHDGVAAVMPLPDGSTGRPQGFALPLTMTASPSMAAVAPAVLKDAIPKPFSIQHPFLPDALGGTFQPVLTPAPGIPLPAAAGPTVAHLQHPNGKYTCWPR
eukprot:EG_transcript_3050